MSTVKLAVAVSAMTLVGRPAHVAPQTSSSAGGCAVEALQQRAPAATTITAASVVNAAGTVPRHCRVDGFVAVPGNTVSFRLALPDDWNTKFYFQGVGGLGGTIGSLATGLTRGYASASTDTGHEANDPTWGENRAKEIDYGHRGTHVTAVAAKALTAAYYSKPPAHAYFSGCSNGGRQALMEVQRHPDDFDGVIAGDPATGTPMQVGRALVFQTMLGSEDHYLPAERVELLARATLASCDAKDGLADGLISDPRPCDFRPERLKCSSGRVSGEGAECLTDGQLATVKQIYGGARDAAGRQYVAPFPFGHEGGASGWRQWITGEAPPTRQADGTLSFTGRGPSGFSFAESNFRFLALEDDDPAFTWRTFRFPADLPRLKTMTGILSPLDPDLRPFRQGGGKLLMYHGWADPGISAYGTLDYYENVVKIAGGQQAADAFVRAYFVPGMHHCSGGPGLDTFDMLPVLEDWVERGVPPSRVTASHVTKGVVERTRPLCPHPWAARYSGSGSVDEAANFTCRLPEVRP